MEQQMDDALTTLFRRRSIRLYVEGKAVEHGKIELLLRAAMAAPSACNIQPWEFIVVTEEDALREIRNRAGAYTNYNAPVAIVVCGSAEFIPWPNDIGEADCHAAIENILIAATALGLGSVWIGGFDAELVQRLLQIPSAVRPVGIVYVGYAAETKEARTKYLPEAVHWEKYDGTRERRPRPGRLVTP